MDPPLCSRKKTPEYGMETSDIACQKAAQNPNIDGKNDVTLGMHKSQFRNTTMKETQ
jgi:hypothetical protein